MKTFEYKFVQLWCKGGIITPAQPEEDYHEIVARHAEQGWRFVQMVGTTWKGWPPSSFELIFERPKGEAA
jgi:Domain of unknown function (DUF4177)